MKQLQLISKNQQERTLKLLQDTKSYLGIDGYLLMKKMLTVSILVDYLQSIHKKGYYISYERFLARNERAIRLHYTINELKSINGLSQPCFFGMLSKTVINSNLADVKYKIIEYWNNKFNNN